MLIKGVLLLLFFISIKRVSSSALVECTTDASRNKFTCNEEFPHHVYIYGVKVECPDDTICNAQKLGKESVDPYGSVICEPCLPFRDMCEESYECVEENQFKLTGQTQVFQCPSFTKCVKPEVPGSLSKCSPCLPESCTNKSWKCTGYNVVVIDEVQGYCPNGKKCNQECSFPYTPCIVDDSAVVYPYSGSSKIVTHHGFLFITFVLCIFKVI